MKIAVIGAGFTGLAAALEFIKHHHEVFLFEKEPYAGGLAAGFKEKGWDWSLEQHYHHWFMNDKSALHLAKEMHLNVFVKRPKTSIFFENSLYQFDSVLHLLRFPKLGRLEKLRMGTALGFLKYNPFWKPMEGVSAHEFLLRFLGRNSYEKIWEPQLISKFGDLAPHISLAWFWARIYKRTARLAYPEGGFLHFAQAIVKEIQDSKGRVFFETTVTRIMQKNGIQLHLENKKRKDTLLFDKVLVTLPSFVFAHITPQLPQVYKKKLSRLKGLGSINLVLRLKRPFFMDNTYWLSICDKTSPATAIVEHTNFMNKRHYGNEHIVYVGKYLKADDHLFLKSGEEILSFYDPFLQRLNRGYRQSLIGYRVFKAPFTQPIIPKNYSSMIPDVKTPIPNVLLSNIQQIYPWDRGTNYAIEAGEKAAKLICAS